MKDKNQRNKYKTAYDVIKWTKKENYRFLNEHFAMHGQTVLLGDSITEIFNYYELFYDFIQKTSQAVYNRGISGDTSDRLLERLEINALNIKPKNLVILVGTNDIGLNIFVEHIAENIQMVLSETNKSCPNANVVLQAVYPVNRDISLAARYMVGRRSNKKILELNRLLYSVALNNGVQWLDLTDALSDEKGRLSEAYCYDGLHLNACGFEIVAEKIIPLLR